MIGDAAHSMHPMTGLGLNSGIADAVFLANNIIQNKKSGNDIGEVIFSNSKYLLKNFRLMQNYLILLQLQQYN